MSPPKYISEKEVSRITGRGLQTLRNDRCKGQGLPYRKFGRQVRYLESEVLEEMEARRIDPRPL
ncbi:MAG: helix-turn-helix transcriptional regulator [Thermodesulfobacteriota bacterium]